MIVENLNDTDYQILEFVNSNEPVKLSDIKSNFPNIDSLEYRIKVMATAEFRKNGYISTPIKDTYCLEEQYEHLTNEHGIAHTKGLQIYSMTNLGKKALQDYRSHKKQINRELWIKNAWLPILVSIVTTLIVNWLPLLLSWIQQLFASFH